MGAPTQASSESTSEYYLWQIPDKTIAVKLALEVVDSILPEVLRAYAAVPKRGAETGGVLLGHIERKSDGPTVVFVDQVEIVACVYARGPSYFLTEEDGAAFAQARAKWDPAPSGQLYVVGYFRSHTRDGLSLSSEDLELMDRHFTDPANVALLIRPFAGKPSQAGFFFREGGVFQKETPLSFLFSRKEIGASPALELEHPEILRSIEPRIPIARPIPSTPTSIPESTRPVIAQPETHVSTMPGAFEEESSKPLEAKQSEPRRILWKASIWASVSIVCLLVGMVAGVLAPQYVHVPFVRPGSAEFSLGLGVGQSTDGLAIHWNPAAPAIRAAQKGTLEIEDGGYVKPVDLDSANLLNGSIIYRNSSPSVRVKLVVMEGEAVTVAETAEWVQ